LQESPKSDRNLSVNIEAVAIYANKLVQITCLMTDYALSLKKAREFSQANTNYAWKISGGEKRRKMLSDGFDNVVYAAKAVKNKSDKK